MYPVLLALILAAPGGNPRQTPAMEDCFRKLGWKPPLSHITVSPDGKWAVVDPAPDPGVLRTRPLLRFQLVDLVSCASVKEFQEVRFHFPGRFSSDSREYQLYNPDVFVDGKPFNMGRVFVLKERKWVSRLLP